jgi:hypothetical protein
MNTDIAEILRAKIAGLNFIDRLAGLIRPLIKIDVAQDDQNVDYVVRKVFPIACNVTAAQCEEDGRYLDLVPNDKYAPLMYFEDRGVVPVKREGDLYYFKSRLRLVGWINLNRFDTTSCSISAMMVMILMKQFPNVKFNSGNYQRISITSLAEAPKSSDIFGAYSYLQETNQYLLYPYDYFAIDIETDFAISSKCIEDDALTIKSPDC